MLDTLWCPCDFTHLKGNKVFVFLILVLHLYQSSHPDKEVALFFQKCTYSPMVDLQNTDILLWNLSYGTDMVEPCLEMIYIFETLILV